MTMPTFPSLRGQGFPATRSPLTSTISQKAISGKETRLQLWTYPRYKYEVTFNALPVGELTGFGASADFETMVGFWNSVAGSALPFHYTDPYDNAVTAQLLGTGTGSAVSYNFVRTLGGFVEPVQDVTQSSVYVYVSDYQGNTLYLSTPRTNFVEYSQALATSPWTASNMTVGSPQTDPLGGSTGTLCLETIANGLHYFSQTLASSVPAVNSVCTVSAFIAPHTRTIAFLEASTRTGAGVGAYFNLSGAGSVGTVVGSGVTAGIAASANGYYRCWVTYNNGAGSNVPSVIVYPSVNGADAGTGYMGNASDGLAVWGVQLETNATVGAYIRTTSAPAAQTDYSFETDANWGLTYGVTFAVAPLSGASVTATFSYQWACRFDEDTATFENFLYNLYNLKKITFTTMKVV